MSTPHDPGAGEEQERVRRLLADLAHTDEVAPAATPPEVAARLEAALAGLREQPGAGTGHDPAPDPVPDLAPGTGARVFPLRRRLAPALAAAAAVVIVAGGGAAVLTSGDGPDAGTAGGSAAEDSSAAESAPANGAQDSSEPSSAPDPGSGDQPAEPAEPPGDAAQPPRLSRVPVLSSGSFAADAERLVAEGAVASADASGTEVRGGSAGGGDVAGSGCVRPDPDLGAATVVSLDGDPVVLVVGPPEEGDRVVTAYACADGAELRTTQVSAGPGGR